MPMQPMPMPIRCRPQWNREDKSQMACEIQKNKLNLHRQWPAVLAFLLLRVLRAL